MKSKNATSHSVKKSKQNSLPFVCLKCSNQQFSNCVPWKKTVSDLSLANFYLLILQVFVIFSEADSLLAGAALVSAHVKTIPYASSSIPVLLHVFLELGVVKYTFPSSHFQLIHKYVKWQTLRLEMLEGRFSATSLHCESWLFLPQLHFLSSKYSSTGRPFHLFHQA